MSTPFDNITAKDATALIVVPQGYDDNRKFYDGDHWNDATFWIGPQPDGSDAQIVLAQIKKAVISKNAIAEVVNRHVAAILRHECAWSLTLTRPLGTVAEVQEDGTTKEVDEQPNEQEQALIDEAEALLTTWWDARGALSMLQDAAVTLLLGSRAPLRLYVPSGLLVEGQVPQGELSDSLSLIYADPPPALTVATVGEDAKSRRPVGVYVFTEDNKEQVEVTYLDGDETVLRILGGEGASEAGAELFRFNFGKRLPMYEMKRAMLVTPQVRQQQMLLNLAATMMGRNVVLGGFLERVLLNAQLPGRFEGSGDSRRFIPDPLQVGAGTTNVLTGIPIYSDSADPEKITGYATPSVNYRDPVTTKTFIETQESAYRGILDETQQTHAVVAGLINVSGESRKQARADFLTSLADTTTQLERAGRWLLETLLAMASAFSGQEGRFEALRAVFTCRIDVGPISADDMGATRDNVRAGLLSEESGMAQIGVEDVDAEKAKIAAERDERMVRAAKLTQAQPPLDDETPPDDGQEQGGAQE